MIAKQAKVSKEDLQKIAQIDVSLQHWQNEYCNMQLTAKNMLSNIEGLHQARHQILTVAYKEAGINPASIVQANINKDGVITAMCHPEAPATPAAPAEAEAAIPNGVNGVSPEAVAAPAAPESPTS